MIITASSIKDILGKYQLEATKDDYFNRRVHDYYYIKDGSFTDIANEILQLTLELRQENAELSAKVKVYEAIIENSNFKMVVQKPKKGGEE